MLFLKKLVKKLIPAPLYKVPLAWWHRPRPRFIHWGNLRRLSPVSRVFGADRGQSIDRYYIESFLEKNKEDIHGRVLEIGDPSYTQRFGGSRVTQSDVLHVQTGNPHATMIGNLETGEGIPKDAFDCMILTQTFPFIYEMQKAIATCHAALRPGGILLVTLPGISQISRYDMDLWGDFWRFTDASCHKLFGELFVTENVKIEVHGNVLAACAFLQGIASHELKKGELNHVDLDYQMLITTRAKKQSK